MKNIALYAGSFDPITNGHMAVIRQSLAIADEVIVAVGVHPGKVPMFSFEERAALIMASVKAELKSRTDNVRVISFDNLVVDLAKAEKANILVRGLRNATDFDYEMQMAGMNGEMAPSIQTVFFPADKDVRHITGTLVRQIAKMGGNVTSFVPATVAEALKTKLN